MNDKTDTTSEVMTTATAGTNATEVATTEAPTFAQPHPALVIASDLAMILNGNKDPRSFTEIERDAALTFIRESAKLAAGIK